MSRGYQVHMLAVPEQEKGISDIDVLICLPTAWMWKLGLRFHSVRTQIHSPDPTAAGSSCVLVSIPMHRTLPSV